MKSTAGCLAVALMAAAPGGLEGCGDKFLRVGRGARYQRGYAAVRPACILIYASPGSSLSAALRELEPALKKAGHKATVVEAPAAVGSALASGAYNVVLAGLADVAVVQSQAKAAPVPFDVLPVLHQPSASDREAAGKRYHCVAEAPGRKADVLARIDDVMERFVKGRQNRKEP
jgi:hypothetical protein